MDRKQNGILRRALIVLLAGVFISLAGGVSAQEVKFLRMVTSVPQGSWYPIGAKICQKLEEITPGLSATVVPGGGTNNCKTVNKGGIANVGWTYANTAIDAYDGRAPFKQPLKNIRYVASLYVNILHIAVQKGRGIKEIPDLIDKSIAVGPKAFTWNKLIEILFKQYGFDYDKMGKSGGTVNHIMGSQVVKMMKDGNLDAMLAGLAGLPYPLMVNLDRAPGFELLEVKQKYAEKMLATVNGLVRARIPKGTYKSVNKDIETIGSVTSVICNKDLPDEFVYNLTKLIWEQKGELAKVNRIMNQVKIDNALRANMIPLHPGALKYYREKGIIK